MTTNLEFGKWNSILYNEKLTSVIVDRLIIAPSFINL
ncbi:MAG: hypothetical protein WCG23_10145 [bacterium]